MNLRQSLFRTLAASMCLMLSASGYAERRQMKILAVGNSFTVDAVQDDLVPMAAADSIDLIIGYPYKGGTSLKQHLQYITADSTKITATLAVLLALVILFSVLLSRGYFYPYPAYDKGVEYGLTE